MSTLSTTEVQQEGEFSRSLGLYDSTMVVAGTMIGSGIFIVTAEMSRQLGSSGWLLAAWLLTGLLTVTGALSYGELASMMPRAGGQYVYLREAFSPLCGFLYGWTLFLVIQTGTIAAVGVGFARFLGVLWPTISEKNYLIAPIHLSSGYAVSLSTAQAIALVVIFLLTWTNSRGVKYGRIVQNVFTVSKLGALFILIAVGFLIGASKGIIHANFSDLWTVHNVVPIVPGLSAVTVAGLIIALGVSQTGSLFAADAWNNITFTAAEVQNPKRNIPLSLAFGTLIVIGLFLLANLAYLVTLPMAMIQNAPSDRVASSSLEVAWPTAGAALMAIAIMISTFGCINGLVMSGARAYYAMAKDGLFFRSAAKLNRAGVPGAALIVQGLWAAALVLPRTYNSATQTYGNLYGNLLDYVISAALIFYILTIAGIFRLRATRPNADRPYKAFGYPIVPAIYLCGTSFILVVLILYRSSTTFPGIGLVLLGVPAYWLLKRRNVAEAVDHATVSRV